MRGLGIMCALLAGCDASSIDADAGADACAAELGTLRVCIYGDSLSTTAMSGSATARRDAADIPWIMQTRADGCTEELLEVGTWEVSGSDTSGTCVTPFSPVEIRACELTEVRAEVYPHCVDG